MLFGLLSSIVVYLPQEGSTGDCGKQMTPSSKTANFMKAFQFASLVTKHVQWFSVQVEADMVTATLQVERQTPKA